MIFRYSVIHHHSWMVSYGKHTTFVVFQEKPIRPQTAARKVSSHEKSVTTERCRKLAQSLPSYGLDYLSIQLNTSFFSRPAPTELLPNNRKKA